MSPTGAHLTLYPERCDRCGRCKGVCPTGALKVSASYLYVDWRRCDGCLLCVQACDRKAIQSRVVPLRKHGQEPTVPIDEVRHTVVGSRAEAKRLRARAEKAAKGTKRGKQQAHPEAAPVAPVAEAVTRSASPRLEPTLPPPLLLPPPPSRSPSPALPPPPKARTSRTEPPKTAVTSRAAAFRTPAAASETPGLSSATSAPWGLVDAIVVLAILAVALIFKNAVLALGPVSVMPALGKSIVRAIVLTAFYAGQIAAYAWLAGRHGVPALQAFGLRTPKGAVMGDDGSPLLSAGLVAALFFACEAVSIGYGLAMQALGVLQPVRLSSDLTGVFGSGPVAFAVAVALVVVAAPLAEEIAFRGIVLAAVGDRWGMWVGIGVSSALYAAYHASVWLFLPTAVLGVALGWLAWTRRTLWPAVALHMLFNGVAVFAAFASAK